VVAATNSVPAIALHAQGLKIEKYKKYNLLPVRPAHAGLEA
jgi:hypothetical protein